MGDYGTATGMRREQYSLAVSDLGWVETDERPRLPTLSISFDGELAALRERLLGGDDRPPEAENVDLAVRLHRRADNGNAEAIVALTRRLTGDYIVEVSADPETLLAFARAARRYGESTGGSPKYRIRLLVEGDELTVFEKDTLLVYGPDGELLQQHSIIPGGVEL